jgi:hypothetical protein
MNTPIVLIRLKYKPLDTVEYPYITDCLKEFLEFICDFMEIFVRVYAKVRSGEFDFHRLTNVPVSSQSVFEKASEKI